MSVRLRLADSGCQGGMFAGTARQSSAGGARCFLEVIGDPPVIIQRVNLIQAQARDVASGAEVFLPSAAERSSDETDFLVSQRPIFARRKRCIQLQRPHALAMQGSHFVIKMPEHAFDLVIAAFDDAQARRPGAQ